jgi:hypothetical protein
VPVFDPALRGFGDLASALLLAPQQARQRRIEEEDKLIRQQDQDRALQQALMFRQQDQVARDRDRADRLAYQKQQFDLEQNKYNTGLEQTKAERERQVALDKEAERVRTFNMAKDMAEQGRNTMEYFQKRRDAEAKAKADADKATPTEVKPPKIQKTGTKDAPDYREFDPATKTWKPMALSEALQVKSPSGQILKKTPEGGYVPETFQQAELPNVGIFTNSGIDPEMNAVAEADRFGRLHGALARQLMASAPHAPTTVPSLPAPRTDNAEGIMAAVSNMSPAAQASARNILASGDPAKIAELQRRIAAMGH